MEWTTVTDCFESLTNVERKWSEGYRTRLSQGRKFSIQPNKTTPLWYNKHIRRGTQWVSTQQTSAESHTVAQRVHKQREFLDIHDANQATVWERWISNRSRVTAGGTDKQRDRKIEEQQCEGIKWPRCNQADRTAPGAIQSYNQLLFCETLNHCK